MLLLADINVLVSGLTAPGPSSRILEAIARGDVELALSTFLLGSMETVFHRLPIAMRLERRGLTPLQALDVIRRLAVVVEVPEFVGAGSRDPDDNAVLACAVAVGADIIVTGDKDLLVLRAYEGIAIMSPIDALRTLGLV